MKKFLIAGACLVALSSVGFAQPSQPQGGASQSPTSPTASSNKDMKNDGMKNSGTTDKGAMNKDTNTNPAQGTTGNAGTSQGADKK